MTNQVIPDEAIAAGLAAWGQCPVGVSPKRQMANILEAAAPHLMAQALHSAADAIEEDPYDDLDPFYAGWLRSRAEKIKEGE